MKSDVRRRKLQAVNRKLLSAQKALERALQYEYPPHQAVLAQSAQLEIDEAVSLLSTTGLLNQGETDVPTPEVE